MKLFKSFLIFVFLIKLHLSVAQVQLNTIINFADFTATNPTGCHTLTYASGTLWWFENSNVVGNLTKSYNYSSNDSILVEFNFFVDYFCSGTVSINSSVITYTNPGPFWGEKKFHISKMLYVNTFSLSIDYANLSHWTANPQGSVDSLKITGFQNGIGIQEQFISDHSLYYFDNSIYFTGSSSSATLDIYSLDGSLIQHNFLQTKNNLSLTRGFYLAIVKDPKTNKAFKRKFLVD